MRHKQSLALVATVLGTFLAAAPAGRAQCPCACPCGAEDRMRRAGCPQDVACWAVPSDTGHYIGYYVGGGAPCHGDAPCPDEGTWGWDYRGLLIPKNIVLGWWHGRRYQNGIGAYRVNGRNCDNLSTP
jgi:hypothetical protein